MAVCGRPGFTRKQKRLYASRLLLGLAEDVLIGLARRGIVVNNLFARSRMPDGIRLLEDMHFKDLPASDDTDKRLFILNVETSESLFVKRYKEALQKYQSA